MAGSWGPLGESLLACPVLSRLASPSSYPYRSATRQSGGHLTFPLHSVPTRKETQESRRRAALAGIGLAEKSLGRISRLVQMTGGHPPPWTPPQLYKYSVRHSQPPEAAGAPPTTTTATNNIRAAGRSAATSLLLLRSPRQPLEPVAVRRGHAPQTPWSAPCREHVFLQLIPNRNCSLPGHVTTSGSPPRTKLRQLACSSSWERGKYRHLQYHISHGPTQL
ncbi:hypothetical protein B0T11DRAFT_63021 [Plectosphaerella cucumerina]|uniref:Uncharacterized protein n=1 Tax=Plectosphaerella cucumerina TaxID=40658 RepID=A0A8K0TK91_9PEZI|nr:hypothetical protein B0T11DRAFT_63021 [Plectosphaerella cucumerina]